MCVAREAYAQCPHKCEPKTGLQMLRLECEVPHSFTTPGHTGLGRRQSQAEQFEKKVQGQKLRCCRPPVTQFSRGGNSIFGLKWSKGEGWAHPS